MSAEGGDGTPGIESYGTSPLLPGLIDAKVKALMEKQTATRPALRVVDKPQFSEKLIEPQPRDVIFCTYPATLDGRLAAWVVRGVAKKHFLHVEFDTNTFAHQLPDLSDRNYIAVGASAGYAAEEAPARSRLEIGTAGPAPIPFAQWERSVPFGVKTMTTGSVGHIGGPAVSQALAAYNFFHATSFEKTPRLIDYVNDAVSGAWKLNGTASIIACVESYPGDFQTLDKLVEACDDRKRREMMFVAGQAILRHIEQQKTPA